MAQPDQHGWRAGDAAPTPGAGTGQGRSRPASTLACYGLLVRFRRQFVDQMLLWFVAGRPVSAVTTDFLTWCCDRLAAQEATALLLVWDNASWQKSQAVRTWIRSHNRTVKQTRQGLRILPRLRPAKNPWLNPIEPKWVHGKRAVSEPDRILSADELEARICVYDGCEHEAHLVMPKKVA